MDVHVVTDTATREELAEAIAVLRDRAKRYSINDPRREDIDAEVDVLVERWMLA